MTNLIIRKDSFLNIIEDTKLISDNGPAAKEVFLNFLTAEIRNKNTRITYATAISKFSAWLESLNLETNSNYGLDNVQPFIIASYIEYLQTISSLPTVKQNLSAINKLFNYMVVNQIIPSNPAAPVKSPKYSQKLGKAPVLNKKEARLLLDSIKTDTIMGKRDKAILALMIYSFSRVSAAINMRVKDFYRQGLRYFFRLHEKGGKMHSVPAHNEARELVYDYIVSAKILNQKDNPLFRPLLYPKNKNILKDAHMTRQAVFLMIKRRAKQAGMSEETCCHSFRATGITTFLLGGGDIETAARIANHELTTTTKLYDRRDKSLKEEEIEKIQF